MIDADHWLWRLDDAAWLAAAEVEWRAAQTHAGRRRTAIAHCRRAAGMALNAVLVAAARTTPTSREQLEQMWGRSYVDHLRQLAAGHTGPLPADACARAAAILAAPMTAPALVAVGARAHADIDALVAHTRGLLDTCADACRGASGV